MQHCSISAGKEANSLDLNSLNMKTRSQMKTSRVQCGQRLVRKPSRAQLKRPKALGGVDVVVAAEETPVAALDVRWLPAGTELERANRAKQNAFDIRRMRATNARYGLA